MIFISVFSAWGNTSCNCFRTGRNEMEFISESSNIKIFIVAISLRILTWGKSTFNFHCDSVSGKVAVFQLPEVKMDAMEILRGTKFQWEQHRMSPSICSSCFRLWSGLCPLGATDGGSFTSISSVWTLPCLSGSGSQSSEESKQGCSRASLLPPARGWGP